MRNFNKNNPLTYIHIPKTGGTSFKKLISLIFYKHTNYKAFFFTDPRKTIVYNKSVNDKSEVVTCHFYNNTVTKSLINADVKTRFSDLKINSNQFITFLREPLNRAESLYLYLKSLYDLLNPNSYIDHLNDLNFTNIKWLILAKFRHRKATKDFIKFFTKYGNNFETFLLSDVNHSFLQHFPIELNSYNYKKKLADAFVFIGIQEDFDESVSLLFKQLGHEAPQSILKMNVTNEINASQKIKSPVASLSQEAVTEFKNRYALDYLIYEHSKELLRDSNED